MINLLLHVADIFPQPSSIPHVEAGPPLIATILKLVFGLAGAISVFVITLAGFQYVLSQGDPQKVAKAKDTIIYAVIGLVVCIVGYALVAFIIGRI
ncbi:MAG: pilin [Candidatus Saccharibacteria bacterium]